MQIEGIEITCLSKWDNQPIKNKLPKELQNKLKTDIQWLEKKRRVRDGEVGYDMHPNSMHKKLCTYYLHSQTEEVVDEVCCATCGIRKGSFCDVMGTYVGMKHKCLEWCK